MPGDSGPVAEEAPVVVVMPDNDLCIAILPRAAEPSGHEARAFAWQKQPPRLQTRDRARYEGNCEVWRRAVAESARRMLFVVAAYTVAWYSIHAL